MTPRRIEVAIGSLVLQGAPAGGPRPLAEAFERELVRLLREQGTPSSVAAQRDKVTVRLGVASGTEMSGVQLARAVYGGLRQ